MKSIEVPYSKTLTKAMPLATRHLIKCVPASDGQGALWPLSGSAWALGLGGTLVVVGQILNVSVLYRLGKVGVFYGNKLGYETPWCRAFPFSLLQHPQYVGTVLSIWGFFLIMRFPHDDWYLLPSVETVYYALGAYFEQ